jgi:RNA polymerase sigma factor (sigma-70 family)
MPAAAGPNEERPEGITREMANLRKGEHKSLARLRISAFFFDQLVRDICRRFRLKGKASVEDAVNSALRIAFEVMEQGGVAEDGSRDDLRALLLAIATCKARNYVRDENRLKRGGDRVRREADRPDDAGGDSADGGAALEDLAVGEEAAGEVTAMVEERCQRLLAVLNDELREIVLWKAEAGYSNAEIARIKGCAEETVRRKILRIRSIWLKELDDDRF